MIQTVVSKPCVLLIMSFITASATLPRNSVFFRSHVLLQRGGSIDNEQSGHFFEPETQQGFEAAALSARKGCLIVVDFGATWCGPCRSISPEFERLAEENAPFLNDGTPPSIIFIKVDVDKIPTAAATFGVNSLPTFVFLRDGAVVSKFSGANLNLLKETIKQNR